MLVVCRSVDVKYLSCIIDMYIIIMQIMLHVHITSQLYHVVMLHSQPQTSSIMITWSYHRTNHNPAISRDHITEPTTSQQYHVNISQTNHKPALSCDYATKPITSKLYLVTMSQNQSPTCSIL